jgi:hypothetical protein
MNMKRMRGRNHRGGGGGASGGGNGGGGGGGGGMRHHGGGIPLNRNHVFDSNGPDIRIRGTSQQLFEKYLQLGRDATSSGDRVMAESYFQHAEHYFRILSAMTQAAQQQAPQNGQNPQRRPNSPDGQNMADTQNYNQNYNQNYGDDGQDGMDGEEPERVQPDRAPPGIGEQPAAGGARDIPIAAAPPEV